MWCWRSRRSRNICASCNLICNRDVSCVFECDINRTSARIDNDNIRNRENCESITIANTTNSKRQNQLIVRWTNQVRCLSLLIDCTHFRWMPLGGLINISAAVGCHFSFAFDTLCMSAPADWNVCNFLAAVPTIGADSCGTEVGGF